MTTTSMKILCLNLWQGGKLMKNILPFIDTQRPDILALQEVYHEKNTKLPQQLRSIEVIQDHGGYPYVYFSPALKWNLKGRILEQGNAILTKIPHKEQHTYFYDMPYNPNYQERVGKYENVPRNLQHVVCEVNGIRINIVNTHGIWGTDGEDNPARLRMSNSIVQVIQGHKNLVLCGDSNTQVHTQTIQNIEKHLTNVFKNELTTSFNMRWKENPGFATAVVDILMVSPDVTVIEHESPEDDVSDHRPLVATLQFQNEL